MVIFNKRGWADGRVAAIVARDLTRRTRNFKPKKHKILYQVGLISFWLGFCIFWVFFFRTILDLTKIQWLMPFTKMLDGVKDFCLPVCFCFFFFWTFPGFVLFFFTDSTHLSQPIDRNVGRFVIKNMKKQMKIVKLKHDKIVLGGGTPKKMNKSELRIWITRALVKAVDELF